VEAIRLNRGTPAALSAIGPSRSTLNVQHFEEVAAALTEILDPRSMTIGSTIDRLKILDDGNMRIQLKKPWSDGTTSVDLPPLAFIARLAALVPAPQRHLTRYLGVLLSHAACRSAVVPAPAEVTPTPAEKGKPASKSKYIPWAVLLRRTLGSRSSVRNASRRCASSP
jgi:hypothetical protein